MTKVSSKRWEITRSGTVAWIPFNAREKGQQEMRNGCFAVINQSINFAIK